MIHAITYMNSKSILLSKRRQTQKTTHTVQFHVYDILEQATLYSCQGRGGQVEEIDCKGAEGKFCEMMEVLCIWTMMTGHIYQNSSSATLKVNFIVYKLFLNKPNFKEY